MKLHEIYAPPTDVNITTAMVKRVWREINEKCFGGTLKEPRIQLETDLNHLVGADSFGHDFIVGFCDEDPETKEIVLLFNSAKIKKVHDLISIVAHEMVHQALAKKYGYAKMEHIGHGPQFKAYAPAIKKYHGVVLSGERM